MTRSEAHIVLHRPVFPPVEVGGHHADGQAGDAGQEEVEEKCSSDPLAASWEEVRKEEVNNSFENARN